ncbi:hypothetical protein [Burkholderia pseudomallei]|uniref:hypothetical protein n=1 Tax=Burkholderia pseudomallei TaxID=28450 RepID=UPI0013E89BF5|nr:hypothetical protein [Burkholderia pseudomallei]MDE3324348.1 hypothetical protein [Burkholderia pseudomallei]
MLAARECFDYAGEVVLLGKWQSYALPDFTVTGKVNECTLSRRVSLNFVSQSVGYVPATREPVDFAKRL